jgi:hypothetical protein
MSFMNDRFIFDNNMHICVYIYIEGNINVESCVAKSDHGYAMRYCRLVHSLDKVEPNPVAKLLLNTVERPQANKNQNKKAAEPVNTS